jgi:hypothetical protein
MLQIFGFVATRRERNNRRVATTVPEIFWGLASQRAVRSFSIILFPLEYDLSRPLFTKPVNSNTLISIITGR